MAKQSGVGILSEAFQRDLVLFLTISMELCSSKKTQPKMVTVSHHEPGR